MSKKTKTKPVSSHATKWRFDAATLLLGGVVLISAAILVSVWFLLTPNRNAGGEPKMQVSTERLDLGKQLFDRTVHASFTVTNVGTGTLTLSVPRSVTLVEGC
ncbi:MAG: hypothetical protein HY741_07920 [Chloroflexi bacterium]|nr:hypothetical protein [Chloroflexota bacterium]